MKTTELTDITLLSPVGSLVSLRAAIAGGANAIYFGIEQLNMRAKGKAQLKLKDIEKIVTYSHSKNVKAYLTLNTILYDHDLSFAESIIKEAKKHGIDAIIAHDPAVISLIRKHEITVHISTQANISNYESVKFYAAFADVMVLSRELTLDQVKNIADNIQRNKLKGPSGDPIRLEIFVHGALCMATSGKCYLSLHSNFASANRGTCVQNCRRKYIVRDAESDIEFSIENEYIMSAKDLCTISFLDQIIRSGATVLKIEGRARSEDYVLQVTSCYREALTAISENNFTREKIEVWIERLKCVFNRGFWDGYYLGRKLGEWHDTDGSVATQKRILIGRNEKYYPKLKVADIRLESNLITMGDEIMITGPVTGVHYEVIRELRVNDVQQRSARKGDLVSIPVQKTIRKEDKIYKIVRS